MKPELGERPPLGAIVAVISFGAPWWRLRARRKLAKFFDGLVAAFRIRARSEPELTVVGEGGRVVVRRRLKDGRDEVRLERDGRARGTLYCDRRELENLYALGILAGAKIFRPGVAAKEARAETGKDVDDSR